VMNKKKYTGLDFHDKNKNDNKIETTNNEKKAEYSFKFEVTGSCVLLLFP